MSKMSPLVWSKKGITTIVLHSDCVTQSESVTLVLAREGLRCNRTSTYRNLKFKIKMGGPILFSVLESVVSNSKHIHLSHG